MRRTPQTSVGCEVADGPRTEQPIGAESSHRLAASKKMGTSVTQPQETEFCQQSE